VKEFLEPPGSLVKKFLGHLDSPLKGFVGSLGSLANWFVGDRALVEGFLEGIGLVNRFLGDPGQSDYLARLFVGSSGLVNQSKAAPEIDCCSQTSS
jgi:hypothetical protein